MTDDDESRRERIAELEMRLRELESASAEMEHRLRRVNDRIEREGIATGSAAAERERLQRNLRLNRRERDEIRGELAEDGGTTDEHG